MQYVVCYDIVDDGRRSRLAAALLDFGARVQESVFVANLDEDLRVKMMERLGKMVDTDADRVHVFALCADCVRKVVMLGCAESVRDAEYYII